jgi:hypothetical protein
MGSDDRQGFNVIKLRWIHVVEQLPERIEVVGYLGQEWLFQLQPYRMP